MEHARTHRKCFCWKTYKKNCIGHQRVIQVQCTDHRPEWNTPGWWRTIEGYKSGINIFLKWVKCKRLLKGINNRSMALEPHLSIKHHATIIRVYTPTMTTPEEAKERVYEDLDKLIRSIPWQIKVFLLRDFNTRACSDNPSWEGVLGIIRVGKCNSNGLLLLRTWITHHNHCIPPAPSK